ncbi:MAG: hypothetical protein AMXMBFR84_11410 [Candidatus Hydrogenedentota bacterium]
MGASHERSKVTLARRTFLAATVAGSLLPVGASAAALPVSGYFSASILLAAREYVMRANLGRITHISAGLPNSVVGDLARTIAFKNDPSASPAFYAMRYYLRDIYTVVGPVEPLHVSVAGGTSGKATAPDRLLMETVLPGGNRMVLATGTMNAEDAFIGVRYDKGMLLVTSDELLWDSYAQQSTRMLAASRDRSPLTLGPQSPACLAADATLAMAWRAWQNRHA